MLAVLVAAFAIFYPYLSATGSCGEPGCPQIAQAHAPGSFEPPPGAFVVALTAAPVALAFAGRLMRRSSSDRKPAEVYLSPEPHPPSL